MATVQTPKLWFHAAKLRSSIAGLGGAMAAKKSKKKSKKGKASAPARRGGAKRVAKKVAAKPRGPRVHEMVHWEIQAQNPEALQGFYAAAFGWKIDSNNPMRYGMVSSKGRAGIDGGIGGTQGPGSRVVVYTSVPSIPPVLEKIESLGGATVMPRTDIGPVIMALYRDLEDNVMGLIEG